MKVFCLPDIGEGLQESEIVSWHVSAGDHVVADQPLVSVETDKAVVELPAPWSGTISRLCGDVGDIVVVGAPLVEFEDNAEKDAGAIVGRLETAPAATEHAPIAPVGATGDRPTNRSQSNVSAAPAVRAYAAQRGVDLGAVRGSGRKGTITRSDVDAAAALSARLDDGWETVSGARRALAVNMTRAGQTVVPATVTDLIDITAWWQTGADVTARALIAVVAAARKEPALNAWFDGNVPARMLHENIDIGLAVDTHEGLFVPVIRNAGALGPSEIRRSVDELVAKARDRTLSPADLQGPTITVSNFGAIAGRHASLIFVPPQVAIIGIGRTETALQLECGVVEPRSMLPVSLTFDHRAVTGGEAARFLRAFAEGLRQGGGSDATSTNRKAAEP